MIRTPYIILCSGQSNMARITPDIHWEPPKNLRVWQYSVLKHEEGVGDSFIPPPADIGNYANFYGAHIARNNPALDVYLVNISKGGTNLQQWLPSAESVNMMNAIKANMSAAIQDIPQANTIDEIIWWGHESDGVPNAYVTSDRFVEIFNEVIDEIDAQDWVGETKPPVRLHRLYPKSHQLASQVNYALECLVEQHSTRFELSDTTHFSYTDNIHLDPDEKEAAAKHVLTTPGFDALSIKREPQLNMLHNGDFSDREIVHQAMNPSPHVPSITPWFAKGSNAEVKVMDGVAYLNDKGKLAQKISRRGLQDKVVTLSMEDVEKDLKVQIGNHVAYVYAGEGRRQASFSLHSVLRRKVMVSIEPADGKQASLSKIKLEFGGVATTYTHKSEAKGLGASLSNWKRRVKRRFSQP